MKSNNFHLRKLVINDAKQHYLDWLLDKDVNRFLGSRFKTHSVESLKDYIKSFDQKDRYLFGIFYTKSDLHIGNITLDINHYNVAYFGYLIGDKKYWGTTAATEAICILLDFAFDKMNVRKIWGGISKNNIPAIFNVHRFGFKREGILRENVIDDGKPTDSLYYGIFKHEWYESKKKFDKIKRIIE